MKSAIRYWLPVILWMALIFGASTGLGASQHTSRLIRPVLLFLFPDIDAESMWQVVFVIRKTAHVVEYAILGILCWRALRRPVSNDSRPWQPRHAVFAVAMAAAYAASDEAHQFFVASRTGSPWDVLLDTSGALLGVLLVWLRGRWRKRW